MAEFKRSYGSLQSTTKSTSGKKSFLFRANDGDFDRYQDRNKVSGWKLENYRANPVVLLGHDDGAPTLFSPPRPVMPIGKARVYTTFDALMTEIEFDPGDPLAMTVERKIEGGFLNAVSVRYRLTPGKYKLNDRGGIDSDEQELLEISVVNLPGNQRAVLVAGPSEAEKKEFVRLYVAAVSRHLEIDRISRAVVDEVVKRIKS